MHALATDLSTLDIVGDLHRRGLSVIPLRAGEKIPAVEWKAYQARQATFSEISEWFGYAHRNVGIVTGAVSGIVVVDVDNPELIHTLGPLPTTPTVKTGKGLHLYFKHPGYQVGNFKLPCGDVRGDGGYVVAPPSVHPSGAVYQWTIGLDVPFADLPASIRRLQIPELEASNDNEQTTSYGRTWFKDVETLAHTNSGHRNTLLNEVACKAGSLIASGHLSESEAIDAMLSACERNGLTQHDGLLSVQATMNSGLRVGQKNPRQPLDTPLPQPSSSSKLLIDRLSNIEEKPIAWLWPGVLAKGALSIIAGPAGLGKSTITQDIGARVSSGDYWPTSKDRAPVGNVIVLSLEDDAAARIKPRMIEAGANIDRVHVIRGTEDKGAEASFNLAEHIHLLDEAMIELGSVSLVVIDPVTAYLGNADSNNMKDVRPVMSALTNLAAKHEAAIIMVSHLNKNESGAAINRVLGSGAFVQAARVYYMVERDRDDSNRRIMTPGKNNLARDNRGFAFRLESRTRPSGDMVQKAIWDDFSQETTADQLISQNSVDGYAVTHAKEFLEYELGDGPISYAEIKSKAEKSQISTATLYRAKEKLGIVSEGKGKNTAWSLRSQAIIN